MKNLMLLAVFAMVLTVFNACEKESIDLKNDEIEDLEIVGQFQFLKFNSQEQLEEVINSLKNGRSDKYEELISDYSFISLQESNGNNFLKSAQLGNRENIEEEPDDSIVCDPYLIKLLDAKRGLEVDGYYYRITKYGMLRCCPDNIYKLDQFISERPNLHWISNKGERNEFITVAPDVELLLPKTIFSKSNNSCQMGNLLKSGNIDLAQMNECDESNKTIAGDIIGGLVGYSVNCENNYSSNRRVKTTFWAQNWFFYSSVGIRTKMQKRSFGIWWAQDAQDIELGWEKIEYKLKYDLNPEYLNIALSENILNYHFYDLGHLDKIVEIAKNIKISTGSDPSAMKLHEELCERNFKEWTLRQVNDYTDIYADLIWYTKKGNYDRILNEIRGKTVKNALSWLKGELQYSPDPDHTNTYLDFDNLSENKVITLIDETMEVTRFVLPRQGALAKSNENKIEKILDYSSGAIGFGYSNIGGKSFFNFKLYKSPTTFSIQDGSSIYGLARYDNIWKGSRIVKN